MATMRSRDALAWLLRVNRALGPEAGLRSARRFAEGFHEGSGALSASQVSRWETGKLAIKSAVVERYECLLGLAPHTLSIAHEAASIFWDGLAGGLPGSRPPIEEVHGLLDRAGAVGQMHDAHWYRLAGLIRTHPDLVLHPPRLWDSLAHTLMTELVVAERRSWLVRQVAMSRLLDHRASRSHMIDACTGLANDSLVPVYIEPISLLDAADHPVANRYVLDELRAPRNVESVQGALLAATSKVRRGHYSRAEQAELRNLAGAAERFGARHLAITPLWEELEAALMRKQLPSRGSSDGEFVVAIGLEVTARLPVEVAEPDVLLQTLLHEAIFSQNSDARLYAASLIAATPYRQPVAEAVANRLSRSGLSGNGLLLERGLRLISLLASERHQRLVRAFLHDPGAPAQVRYAAVSAARHSVGGLDETTWRVIAQTQLHLAANRPSPLDADILRGLVYSVGTMGYKRLLADLAAHPSLPDHIRLLASWWHRQDGVRG